MTLASMTRRALIVSAVLTLFAPGARVAAAQGVHADSAILTILRTRVDSGRAPAIVVGIIEHGKRRYVSYGSAGEGRTPLDAHTLFEIGSISKTFTGLLLADAVTRGEVRLDEPVTELLPAGTTVPSRDGKPVTLLQLSTHRSGLPRLPTNMAPADVADPYADYDTKRLYEFLASYTLTRAPGERAEYSNLGGGLLGHALTRKAGMTSWGELVARRVTGPLGMQETFVDVPPQLMERLSTGHDERMMPAKPWRFDALAGAGALRSSAADMLTYLAAELDTASGPLAKAIAMGRVPRAEFAPGSSIALAWMVSGSPVAPIWWHNGGTGGFRSFVAFDPARQVGVVVLANSAISVDDIGMHLMYPLAPLVMPILPPRVKVAVPAATLDRLVGEYVLSPAMSIRITREGDALFAQATGQGRFPLTATGTNRFVFPPSGVDLTFDLPETGLASQLTLRQGGGTFPAPRRP